VETAAYEILEATDDERLALARGGYTWRQEIKR
jgi:hypothetical protein